MLRIDVGWNKTIKTLTNRFRNIITYKHLIILILLLSFHCIANYIWLNLDTTPALAGSSRHLTITYNYTLKNSPSELITYKGIYPPFFYLSVIPFYWLFGVSEDIAIMTNVIYLGIMFFSVYFIGKKIFNENVGLLAAFILSTFPIIFGLSRLFYIDIALTAIVTLSIVLLIYSNHFKNKKYSLLFGISFGLGMLTKFTYFLFIIGPLFYLLYKDRLKNKKNFFISIILGLMITSIWYVGNVWYVYQHIVKAPNYSKGPNGMDIQSLTWYIYQLPKEQISLFYFMVFSFILVYLILKKDLLKIANIQILASWFLIPFVLFSLFTARDDRFVTPLLPVIAIFISIGVHRIRNSTIRVIFILLIILIGTVQFFIISFTKIHSPPIYNNLKFFESSIWYSNPKNDDWKIDSIVNFINENRKGQNVTVEFIDTNHPLNRFEHYSNYVLINKLSGINMLDENNDTLRSFDYDYLIFVATFNEPKYKSPTEYLNSILNNASEGFIKKFNILNEFELPDSSIVYVYKKR